MNNTLGVPVGGRTGCGHAGDETSNVRPITPGKAAPGGYSTSGGGSVAVFVFAVALCAREAFVAFVDFDAVLVRLVATFPPVWVVRPSPMVEDRSASNPSRTTPGRSTC
jgi:hypothetical protein